jgi:D-cysteine desulfhydrase family pyridoxal phosphate-dependent enzyme
MARKRGHQKQKARTSAPKAAAAEIATKRKAVIATERRELREVDLDLDLGAATARPAVTLATTTGRAPATPDLPWVARYPARIPLGFFPTPIEKLERLGRELGGPEIYVKRDDQTGLATGGNKSRKLEFLMADARERGCSHLVTIGGPQSNHVRQTAAAAARLGFDCTLVLRGDPPSERIGNLLLDELFGAHLRWAGRRNREAVAWQVMAEFREMGIRPYLIPLGGSNALGALGYVRAMEEALDQLSDAGIAIDTMVVASSSAGTQAGMALGAALREFKGEVLGISIDSTQAELSARVRSLALEACKLCRNADAGEPDLRVVVNDRYLGRGYARVGDLEREAIRLVARTEGLLLDPVYTGRAMGGMIDLIRRGMLTQGQRVLFWHTGGLAALSAFSRELADW